MYYTYKGVDVPFERLPRLTLVYAYIELYIFTHNITVSYISCLYIILITITIIINISCLICCFDV